MPTEPSAFIQAHRMLRVSGLEPFRQWQLALVVLLVTYLPLAILWFGYDALMSAAAMAIYDSEEGLAGGGMDPILAQTLIHGTDSVGVLLLLFGVVGYPFIIWGMVVWWRSQGAGITLKASLKSLWWVGVIYLIPMVVSGISALPLYFADFDEGYLGGELVSYPEPSLLLPNLLTFLSYWLIFRLAAALVTAAQGRGMGLKAGWQVSAADSGLTAFIALDLTVLSLLLDAASKFLAEISNARWERELENHDLDMTSLTLFDSAVAGAESLVVTWLIFVELALVWSLAQHYRQGKTDFRESL